MLNLKLLDPITKVLTTGLGLLKDTKGKLSSKRTISGVIILAATTDMSTNGITVLNLILVVLGILPVLFTIGESGTENADSGKK